MKGQILGFDGEKGAITGEDGNRYSFELAEWKGEKPPQARDNVDFVAKDGVASEIYKTAASFSAPSMEGVSETLSSVGASLSEVAEKVDFDAGKLDYLRTRPQLILIGLTILAFFFLNLVVIVGNGVSAFSLPSELEEAAAVTGLFGRGGDFSTTSTAGSLLWLIPLGGAFAIFNAYRGKSTRIAELVVAVTCFFSFIVYAMVVASFENLTGGYQRFDQAISLGFGGYIFLLCGIGLILTALRIVKTVPGLKAPEAPKAK